MFVGHGLLAFALAAAGARLAGWAPQRALALGLLAGTFGLAPDVDILYAPVGVLGSSGPFEAASGFWSAGNRVHRAVTHSLIVGSVASLAAGALAAGHRRPRGRAAGVAGAVALVGLVATTALVTGALGAVVMAAFVACVAVLSILARSRRSLGPRAVTAAAAVGLLTHPFGDLFTGEPPALLYPLDVPVFAGRVALAPDPTLHLLGALFVELGTAWLAVGVLLWIRAGGSATVSRRRSGPRFSARPVARLSSLVHRLGTRTRRSVDGRAGVAVGYAGIATVLPAPTLDVSYHFVLPLLGVGLAVTVLAAADREPRVPRAERAAVSGLTAISLAAGAYALLYVLLG